MVRRVSSQTSCWPALLLGEASTRRAKGLRVGNRSAKVALHKSQRHRGVSNGQKLSEEALACRQDRDW